MAVPELTAEQIEELQGLQTKLDGFAEEVEQLAGVERKAIDELIKLETDDPTQKLEKGFQEKFKDQKEHMLKRYKQFEKYAENCRKNGLHKMQNTNDGLEALQALMEYLIGLFLGRMIEKIAAAKTPEDLKKITPGSVMREVTSKTLNEMFHTDKFGEKMKPVMEGVLKGTMLPGDAMGRTAEIVGNGVNALIAKGEPDMAAYQELLDTKRGELQEVRDKLETNQSSQAKIKADMARLRGGASPAADDEPEPPRDDLGATL